ncbi:hypothetical protein EUTSA_v10009714mg, partial [Eutrema salsugineum]
MGKLNAYLISILLIMASLYPPPSHRLLIDGLSIDQVAIFGIARCDLNGDLSAPPISNGTVVLTCGGSTANLAETVTNLG